MIINRTCFSSPGADQPIRLTHRPQLLYTEAVIQEAMRLLPVSPLSVPRATHCDVEIRTWRITLYGYKTFQSRWGKEEGVDIKETKRNGNDKKIKMLGHLRKLP